MYSGDLSKYNYGELLLNHHFRIAVWGVGYIGFSNLCFYGKKGVKGIGVDIDERIVSAILNNDAHLKEFDYWLGFDYHYLVSSKMITVTSNWRDLQSEQVLVHFVCVPTEKNDLPFTDIVFDVIEKIARLESENDLEGKVVLVESTLTPGTAARLEEILSKKISKTVYFGVSPRRDWFMSGDKNLAELIRIYGGNSPQANLKVKEVLSLVCNNLMEASDYRHAEAVKSIENAFRHLDISFANQLAMAFPDLNIREVLKLAGTKWNMNTYYPSLGAGGYCIPLSSKYVMEGATDSEQLTLLKNTIEFDQVFPEKICRMIMRYNARKVGILGISYKEDIKVDKSSPAVKIANCLIANQILVVMNDPYYTDQEVREKFGTGFFDYLDYDAYQSMDVLIIISAHRFYNLIDRRQLLDNLKNCKVIYDNTGMWDDFKELRSHNIKYKLVGTMGWTE